MEVFVECVQAVRPESAIGFQPGVHFQKRLGIYRYISSTEYLTTPQCSGTTHGIELADKGVRYAVVGGHAVALHGAVRGTVDVDIAVAWNLKSLQSAEQALSGIGLTSRLPISADDVFQFRDEYIENRNLIGWNFYNPSDPTEQVDLVITYNLKGKKVGTVDTTGGAVRILGRKDLIAMKRASGGPQDLEDIKALERLT